jgi:hypothetical protein
MTNLSLLNSTPPRNHTQLPVSAVHHPLSLSPPSANGPRERRGRIRRNRERRSAVAPTEGTGHATPPATTETRLRSLGVVDPTCRRGVGYIRGCEEIDGHPDLKPETGKKIKNWWAVPQIPPSSSSLFFVLFCFTWLCLIFFLSFLVYVSFLLLHCQRILVVFTIIVSPSFLVIAIFRTMLFCHF